MHEKKTTNHEETKKALFYTEKLSTNPIEKIEFIRNYCQKYVKDYELSDENEEIYLFYINQIIKDSYSNGLIDDKDIRTLIVYFMRKYINQYNLNTNFLILPNYLYNLKFGIKSNSNCLCHDDGTSTLYFKYSSFGKPLYDLDYQCNEYVYYALEPAFYELVHAMQYDEIYKGEKEGINNKDTLMLIRELIVKKNNKQYYYENYDDTFTRRNATARTKNLTVDTIDKFFNYFGSSFINRFSVEAKDYLFLSRDNNQNIDDYLDQLSIEQPNLVLPLLSIQYNNDGSLRSPRELESERKDLYKKMGQDACDNKLKEINALYNYLISYADYVERRKKNDSLSEQSTLVKEVRRHS